jgi:hypothetical protein
MQMARRRFEMVHYRQALVRMRQGDSDRQIATARIMGRRLASRLRELAAERRWLDAAAAMPEDEAIAMALGHGERHDICCIYQDVLAQGPLMFRPS